MDKHAFTSMRVVFLALFVLAAPHAHAEMYKWITEDGSVTYSNTPPKDLGNVRDLTRIETPVPASPAPAPARRSAQAPAEAVDPLFVFVPPPPRQPAPPQQPEVASAPRELPPVQIEPAPRSDGARGDSPPRLVYRGAPASAAQDPCLRSSDPRCYERNKDQYHPRLGYMPGGSPAVGATTGGSASGAVGGSSTK